MLNIFGVKLPDHRPVRIGLTAIYGIGFKEASKICNQLGIPSSIRIYQLKAFEISKISRVLKNNYLIEGDLRKEITLNIKRLVSINNYRGVRHRMGLPVRGQRTHTNAQTTRKYLKKKQSKIFKRNYATQEEVKEEVKDKVKDKVKYKVKNKRKPRLSKIKKPFGIAHVQCTSNNTIVTISRSNGNSVCWSSGGYRSILKGSKRSTAYAGQRAAAEAAQKAKKLGCRNLQIQFKGFGRGRNSIIKGLRTAGLPITKISEVTPLPHNGCRPKKRRRV